MTPNELVPNLKAVTRDGKNVFLWDYRQKCHTVLIHEPSAAPETFQAWTEAAKQDPKLWDWLDVQFLQSAEPKEALAAGIYEIDRYGHLIQFVPNGQWNLERIEKDFISYEACNC